MRQLVWNLALVALLAGSGPGRTETLKSYDPDLGQVLDLPPEVEAHVPSDRTVFSEPGAAAQPATGSPVAGETAEPPAAVVPPPPFASAPVAPPQPQAAPAILSPKPTTASAPLPVPVGDVAGGLRIDPGAFEVLMDQLGRVQSLPAGVSLSIRSFYERRDGAPLWMAGASPSSRAQAVLALAERAEEHGMDANRYRALIRTARETGNPALAELAISAAAVLYARDARGGRLNPLQVSRMITANPPLPEAAGVLEALGQSGTPAATLEAFHPRHSGYHALRLKLADLRRQAAGAAPHVIVPAGLELRPGGRDARVPLLRERLGLPPLPDTLYDEAAVAALVAFQKANGLRAHGRLDARTLARLNGGSGNSGPIGDVIANMERWRWLPVDLGADHVFVNVPSFALTLQQGGERVFQTRVVVGKPQTPTPIFSDRMEYLVVNPYWNVPPSIALKEMLPLLQANPYALQARGLEVVSRGKVVDPASIDWASNPRSVAIRQPPGERNALGHIKFIFPNQHAVYLHDTPSRALFARDIRAFSHGCVRVQNPFQLASALLGTGWSGERLRAMVGGPERQLRLQQAVPVHLAYFTTFVDEQGTLVNFPDLYGHNRRMKTLFGL